MSKTNEGKSFLSLNEIQRPERSCVVCRKKTQKRQLLRFVFKGNGLSSEVEAGISTTHVYVTSGIVFDLYHSLPGRGAYCHAEEACLVNARALGQLLFSLRRRERSSGNEIKNIHSKVSNFVPAIRHSANLLGIIEEGIERLANNIRSNKVQQERVTQLLELRRVLQNASKQGSKVKPRGSIQRKFSALRF